MGNFKSPKGKKDHKDARLGEVPEPPHGGTIGIRTQFNLDSSAACGGSGTSSNLTS